MPLKKMSGEVRGRGRPKRAGVPERAGDAKSTPAKRGRAAETDVAESAVEPPKKRGRPPKAKSTVVEQVQAAPVVTKRGGRRKKEDISGGDAPAAPKRGRPKGTAVRTRRLDPRVRSRLRTRVAPTPKVRKEEAIRQPGKRGRPRKVVVEAPALPAKKKTGRKAATSAVVKPAAPRKRRGYTSREIPDKFLAQVDRYLEELLAAGSPDVNPGKEVDDEGNDEVGAEDGEELSAVGPPDVEELSAAGPPDVEDSVKEVEDRADDEANAGDAVEEETRIVEEEVIVITTSTDKDDGKEINELVVEQHEIQTEAKPDATDAESQEVQDGDTSALVSHNTLEEYEELDKIFELV